MDGIFNDKGMMTREKILEEGLLQLYVLGDLDVSVSDAVESVIANDDTLKQALFEMELDLEQMGLENTTSPPASVKSRLMSAISSEKRVQALSAGNSGKYRLWFKLAAAAAVILFFNSMYLIVKNGKTSQQLNEVTVQLDDLKQNQKLIENAYSDQQSLLAFLSDPNTRQYTLKGNSKMPEAKLVSYINNSAQQVMVNTTGLSKLDDEHDYQLWADVEGEMIDMGVIKLDTPLLAMNYIDHAESLNITIEPKGGSEHPTVSNLISNAYLNN